MLEQRLTEHPIRPDMVADYVTLQGWWHLNATYPVVEMALKVLTENIGEKTHHISELYRRFAQEHPERALSVEVAVREYVTFYGVDVNQHPEFASAEAFLRKVGQGNEYIKWRYWPIEKGELKLTWPELLVEIASALSSVLLRKRPYSISQRIHLHIAKAINQPGRWVAVLEQFGTDGESLITELQTWELQHRGLLAAFRHYLENGLDPRWSKALESVLAGAREELTRTGDREVRHFISKNAYHSVLQNVRKKTSGAKPRLRPPDSRPIPRLVEVSAKEPYKLWVQFDNGAEGIIDMMPWDGDIPSAWETPKRWAAVRVEDSAAVWGGWYDACPYSMWRQLVGENRS